MPYWDLQASAGAPGLSINWRGLWDIATSYNPYDAVQAGTAAWISLTNNSGIDPTTDAGTNWSQMVEGPPGPQGPQGPQGVAAGRIFYYAPSDASDISGYKTLLTSPSAGAEQTIATVCTGTSDVLIGEFATDPGIPGVLEYPAGTAYRRIYASVSAGIARIHLRAYIRNAAGTETLVGDEFSADFSNTTVALQMWITTSSSGGAMLETDRVVVKLYAQRVSGPASITVTTYYEGSTNASQIQTTIAGGATTEIYWVRTRAFNSLGNPNFEVNQRSPGAGASAMGDFPLDRWKISKVGSMVVNCTQQTLLITRPTGQANVGLSNSFLRCHLTTQQASLGADDYWMLFQPVEGSFLRELQPDVHSISLYVRSSVAGLKFCVSLISPGAPFYSIIKLCTIPSANTWTLITLPNLPVWTPSATWSAVPGVLGYYLQICLAAGTTYQAPAADVWQAGSFWGVAAMDNFASKAVNSTFDIAFAQHEPGPVCTPFLDKNFHDNLWECYRYYTKSYVYEVPTGTNSTNSAHTFYAGTGWTEVWGSLAYVRQLVEQPSLYVWGDTGTSNAVRNIATGGVYGLNIGLSSYSRKGITFLRVVSALPEASMYAFNYEAATTY